MEKDNRTIVTPRLPDGTRLFIDSDKEIPRGKGWEEIVTDKHTGKKWLLRGASCGLGNCHCDATAEPATDGTPFDMLRKVAHLYGWQEHAQCPAQNAVSPNEVGTAFLTDRGTIVEIKENDSPSDDELEGFEE